MKLRCIFHGRKVNALGIWSFHCVDLEADSADAARLKLYDTHEHISQLRMVDRETGKEIYRGH